MIALIILLAQIPAYVYCWRRIFKKIAFYYVVKQREGYPPQLQPDWGDIGQGIVGATIVSCIWPLVLLTAYIVLIMAYFEPIEIAEKLGGAPPSGVKKAYLENRTCLQLEQAKKEQIQLDKQINEIVQGEIC